MSSRQAGKGGVGGVVKRCMRQKDEVRCMRSESALQKVRRKRRVAEEEEREYVCCVQVSGVRSVKAEATKRASASRKSAEEEQTEIRGGKRAVQCRQQQEEATHKR